MKTHFLIENKYFFDYLKLTVKGKTYYFCDELIVELDDCEISDVDIEFVRAEDYAKRHSKNLFKKLLQNIAIWIVSPLVFFADNDSGIRFDNGFESFRPFTHKKSFSIKPQNERKIYIKYVESHYDKITKKYTKPSLQIKGDGVVEKYEESTFSSATLNQEWNAYHIPAFSVLLLIVLLLNVLAFFLFAKAIRDIPLFSMSENIGGIIGVSLCSLFMISLLIAYIVIIVKSNRVKKEVINRNK